MTRLKCLKCGDIIEGDRKGTYITCGCKAIAIDETEYYVRVIGDKSNFEEIIDPLSYTTTERCEFIKTEEICVKDKNSEVKLSINEITKQNLEALGKSIIKNAEEVSRDLKGVTSITIFAQLNPDEVINYDITKNYNVLFEEE